MKEEEGKCGPIGRKTTRQKKRCPLPSCDSIVYHIPRHLKEVHGWTKELSRTALSRFGLRKSYAYTEPSKVTAKKKKPNPEVKVKSEGEKKAKDYHHYRYCPVGGCTSLVKRLPPHLKKVHKLIPGSKDYKEAMSKVRGPIRDSQRRPYHERPRRTAESCETPSEHPSSSFEVEVISSEEEEKDSDKSAKRTHQDMPSQLVSFEAWLQSADGGKLDQKTSRQHTKQVFKLLNAIDAKRKLLSLFDARLLNDRFLEGHVSKEYSPKTVQSYLMSLRHFFSFSLTDDADVPISKEAIISLRDKVTRWSSSYRVQSSKRHWEKMKEDYEALITPDQINEFERSKAARDAICLLGQLSGAHNIVITQAQYTLIRDFLLVEISIDNANRAGVLANMTVEEFNSSTKENDDYLVLVKRSKTLSTHGPARIVLSPKLKSWIQIYIREVRSQVAGSTNRPDDSVFLSFFGEPMVSSQINKAMKSVWKKADVEGAPSSTLFRKSAVSNIHSCNDSNEARENLADLMAHNISTAKKYYRLQEKSKSSVLASKQLRQVMRQDTEESSSKTNSDKIEKPRDPISKYNGLQEKSKSSVEASKQLRTVMRALDQTDRPDSPPLSSNPPASDSIAPKTSRTSWDEDMAHAIKTLFKDEIKDKAITLQTVKTKISDHLQLKEEDPKRVLDKVRAFWRFSKSPSPETPCLPTEVETLDKRVSRMLPEESETSSDIIPPTVSSSVRNVFKATELRGIKNLFAEMLEHSAPISKPQIKKCLEKEDWGQEMLKKVSLDTVVNRIKYERRLRRASKK